MPIPTDSWPLVTAVVSSGLAGTISFLVSVLSKEQKTSEFRQAWIDALREDLATFASMILVAHDIFKVRLQLGEDMKEIQASMLRSGLPEAKAIEATRLKILLRLNPIEHADLIKHMDAAYAHKVVDEMRANEGGTQLIQKFTEEAQRVLKTEWKRVKQGEPVFRVTKWASLVLAGSSILVALALGVGYLW